MPTITRPCRCDNISGPHYDTSQCRKCWLFHYDPEYCNHWGGGYHHPQLPCRHLGSDRGEKILCPTCTGKVEVKLFSCDLHGECTTNKPITNIYCCNNCIDKSPISTVSNVKIEGLGDYRSFNGSIAELNGRTYLAYRRCWDRARVALVELNTNWQPLGEAKELALGKLLEDRDAQEDPRLFVHRGQLHVSYTGCTFSKGKLHVSICVARLDENLNVEYTWYPHCPARQEWEKNWGFFSNQGDLYAVHSISPHRILLMARHDAWEFPAEKFTLPGGVFGLLRGGCPPILHNGEYYSFFHGCTKPRWGTYSIGVYTFSSVHPFHPKRFCPSPLLWPTPSEKPSPMVADVVFPAGAILRDGHWHVSYGYYDQEIRVATWECKDIERLLKPL